MSSSEKNQYGMSRSAVSVNTSVENESSSISVNISSPSENYFGKIISPRARAILLLDDDGNNDEDEVRSGKLKYLSEENAKEIIWDPATSVKGKVAFSPSSARSLRFTSNTSPISNNSGNSSSSVKSKDKKIDPHKANHKNSRYEQNLALQSTVSPLNVTSSVVKEELCKDGDAALVKTESVQSNKDEAKIETHKVRKHHNSRYQQSEALKPTTTARIATSKIVEDILKAEE